MAKLANVVLSNTFDTWRVRTNDILDRLNAFAINKSLLHANTVIANNVLKASGNTVLGAAGKKTIVNATSVANGYLTVTNRFDVSGNTNLGAAGKKTIINATSVANGYLTVANRFDVSGNTNLGAAGKRTIITGLLSANGRATIGTNLAVSGNTSIGDRLAVSGNMTFSANITGGGVSVSTLDAFTIDGGTY